MASAIELNAISTVSGAHGLAANAAIISEISTFQSTATYELSANIFSMIGEAPSNAAAILYGAVTSPITNITSGHYLLDIYPGNITPVSSSSVNHFGNANVASVSGTITTQINLPFSHGMQGFANVYTLIFGEISNNFDSVASVHILKDKTYADTGIGHSGIVDHITHGLSSYGGLIANTIKTWGTMYDINKINLLDDPYVFGQNLLNQGLGTYGNLSVNLAATGLDVTDITKIPSSTTTTTESVGTIGVPSPYGTIPLSSVDQTVTTTIVTAGSVDVIKDIYKKVVGVDLLTIMSTVGFTSSTTTSISSLNDFLNFKKVVPPDLYTQWESAGVTNFTQFGKFLNSKLGNSNFTSWTEIANVMGKTVAPVLRHTTTNASTPILSSTVISEINSLGTGTGPLNNQTMIDYLGAVAGIGYTETYKTINSRYSIDAGPIESKLSTLKSALTTWLAAYVPYSPGSEGPPLVSEVSEYIPPLTSITSAVNSLITEISAISTRTSSQLCQRLYYTMLNNLTTEVNNLSSAEIKFLASDNKMLKSFAKGIVNYATEDEKFYSKQVFEKLITDDSYGDTILAAMAEKVNTELLTNAGIYVNNDPQPSNAIYQAKAQNIPLSTYLSQNK